MKPTRESPEWVIVRLNSGNLLKRPRKNEKVDFWGSVPRTLVRVWFYWKWFLKLYNFKALPFLFRLKFRTLGWKILKTPEFNLVIVLIFEIRKFTYEKVMAILNGRFQTLFRESVKFSNYGKILWSCYFASKVDPFLQFWANRTLALQNYW